METPEIKEIWKKQVGAYTLIEYEKLENQNLLTCNIYHYGEDFSCGFGSWGMDRDEITEEEAYMVLQVALWYDANVSPSPFKVILDSAKEHFEEDEDTEEIEE